MKNDDLLQRTLKLLAKGNVRYSDRIFEEERAALIKDIDDYFKAPVEPATDPPYDHSAPKLLDVIEAIAATVPDTEWERVPQVKQEPPRPPAPECECCGLIGAYTEDGQWWCPTCKKNPPKKIHLPIIK